MTIAGPGNAAGVRVVDVPTIFWRSIMRTRRLLLASLLAAAVAGSAWAQSATGGVAGSASGAGN